MIKIGEKLLKEAGYKYVITSHADNDVVENLHSRIRLRDTKPTPNKYEMCLKLVALSQIFIKKRGMSYNEASDAYYLGKLIDMKRVHENAKELLNETENTDIDDEEEEKDLKIDNIEDIRAFLNHSEFEEGGFTHHNGFLLYKTVLGRKQGQSCDLCNAYFAADIDEDLAAHELIKLKDFKAGALQRPSAAAIEIFDYAEAIFLLHYEKLYSQSDIFNKMTKIILEEVRKKFDGAPKCHLKRIISKFVFCRWIRLTELEDFRKKRAQQQKSLNKQNANASKSMADLK